MDDALERWADLEFSGWQSSPIQADRVALDLLALAERDPAYIVFHLKDGRIALDPGTVAFQRPGDRQMEAFAARAALYQRFFQDAVTACNVRGEVSFAFFVDDLSPRDETLPILCFQKDVGRPGILVPDIDFLQYNFYADEHRHYFDDRPFDDKRPAAVFVGSTTGTPALSADDVIHLRNPRLRAAVAFRDEPRVTFSLPAIVQYDSHETYHMIAGLDVGGERLSWPQQLDYRYLISMDGNGATCSRVAVGLASNSVLLKYVSASTLFYFHGLEAGVHYLPVASEADVIAIMDRAEAERDRHRMIAQQSARFARTYLNRSSLLRYTAAILRRYAARFGSSGGTAADRASLIDCYAHVQNVGSIWASPPDWLGATLPIEGFGLVPGAAIDAEDVRYAAVLADGTTTDFVRGYQYCGTTGRSLALHGLCITLTDATAKRFEVSFVARFADGFQTQPAGNGAWLFRPCALVAIKVDLIPRQPS